MVLAENGVLTFNYVEPESADYRAFMQDITDLDTYFDDPRLLKFKPQRTFTTKQVIMRH